MAGHRDGGPGRGAESAKPLKESLLASGITTDAGLDVLLAAANGPYGHIAVTTSRGRVDGVAVGVAEPILTGGARQPRPELSTPYERPGDEIQERLVAIWEEHFGVAPVGIFDRFIELGGDSLLAAQIVARLRVRFQLDVPVALLFENERIVDIALAIEERLLDAVRPDVTESGDAQGLDQAARRDRARRALRERRSRLNDDAIADLEHRLRGAVAAPTADQPGRDGAVATSAQRRMWLMERLAPGTGAFNESLALRLRAPLDTVRLQTAFDQLLARHEALRTGFDDRDGNLVPVVAREVDGHLDIVDLRDEPRASGSTGRWPWPNPKADARSPSTRRRCYEPRSCG